MLKLFITCLMVLTFNAHANLESFQVVSTNSTGPKYTKSQVVKMLESGRTCVKDGVKVLFHSKDITKKHCQKAKYLDNVRVIKANQTDFYQELLGLK